MALAVAPHPNPADQLNLTHTRPATKQTATSLLWTLHELGGEYRDKSGRAPRRLVDEAVKRGFHIAPTYATEGTSLSTLLREMEQGRYAGLISREVNGKRTHVIKLLITEDQMPPRPKATVKATVTDPPVPPDFEPEPEPPVDDPQPEPAPEPEPEDVTAEAPDTIDALLMIQRLAMVAAVNVANQLGQAPAPAPDLSELNELKARLAETVEENKRWRRKVTEAGETLHAKTKECEALRKALMVSASNLKAMQKASSQTPSLERKLANLKGVQSFIASPPVKALG